MKTLIELNQVNKTYKMGEVEVKALNNVDLKINTKEFVAIMGPSGSGKSTLLHLIGYLDRPTKGKIVLDGTDISRLNDSKLARLRGNKLGFVFQFFNLYPTLTALENIELPMMIIEKNKNEREKRAMKLLKIVGMEKRSGHLPSQLSGGERQRTAIARALANDPFLVLVDEPTGNLDSKTGEEIMKLFVFESAMIGFVGGLIGIFLGFIASGVISGMGIRMIGIGGRAGMGTNTTVVTPQLVLFAMGFSVFIGIISGLLPARKAASLQPVEALRYE